MAWRCLHRLSFQLLRSLDVCTCWQCSLSWLPSKMIVARRWLNRERYRCQKCSAAICKHPRHCVGEFRWSSQPADRLIALFANGAHNLYMPNHIWKLSIQMKKSHRLECIYYMNNHQINHQIIYWTIIFCSINLILSTLTEHQFGGSNTNGGHWLGGCTRTKTWRILAELNSPFRGTPDVSAFVCRINHERINENSTVQLGPMAFVPTWSCLMCVHNGKSSLNLLGVVHLFTCFYDSQNFPIWNCQQSIHLFLRTWRVFQSVI